VLHDSEELDVERGDPEDMQERLQGTGEVPFARDTSLEQSLQEDERERARRFRIRLMMIGGGVSLFIGES
jgi:hypothetical protein